MYLHLGYQATFLAGIALGYVAAYAAALVVLE